MRMMRITAMVICGTLLGLGPAVVQVVILLLKKLFIYVYAPCDLGGLSMSSRG